MVSPYGKAPRRTGRSAAPAPLRPGEIQINITGRYTLEQFSLEVQRAIARLQDHGVTGLEGFRAQLMPLDETAAPTALQNDAGQQVLTLNIPDKPPSQPYRDNEPGIGVSPGQATPASRSAPRRPSA